MRYHALIIGIDDYADERQKLSSAVKDALAFREALLEHQLADEGSIELLTAPVVQHARGRADSNTILEALERYYRAGEAIEKFIFYYAGHGISALSDAAGNRPRTVLVPVDVEDLQRHGRRLIDLDELRELFQQTGPLEQLFFIDACRDLSYEKQPSVASLGLSGERAGTGRRQATLFAVSPLGTAKGRVGGHGAFTEQLLEGLRGEGRALDFDATLDAYVITMQSLYAHAHAVVLERLKDATPYVQAIQLPDLVSKSPPGPLRTFVDVESRALTVHIDPDSAADDTEVILSLRRQVLGPDYCYPSRQNHETVLLQPQVYSVRASSRVGRVEPAHAALDVRIVREHTVRIVPPELDQQLEDARPAAVPDSGILRADISESQMLGFLEGESSSGTVSAVALERHVTISLTQLESPYERRIGVGALREVVPLGPYRVDFQLGASVFSSSEVYVDPDTEVSVAPKLALTPLLQEALELDGPAPGDVEVSESIGPIQAGVLGTTLTILGVKPFDHRRELFSQFENLVQVEDPHDYDLRPVSIVLAADGRRWPWPVAEMLDCVDCQLLAPEGNTSVRLERPLRSALRIDAPGDSEQGLQRIRYGLATPPGAVFEVVLRAPQLGKLHAVSAAVAGRVTELVWIVRPDGAVELRQQLLPLPGLPFPGPQHPQHAGVELGYGPLLRLLFVAQELHRCGDLLAHARRGDPNDDLIRDLRALLKAEWVDPLLSCMAYYAGARERERASDVADLPAIAHLLGATFPQLTDARVVAALEHSRRGDTLESPLEPILAEVDERPPLLLESAQHLAAYAVRSGRPDASIVERVRWARPDQLWLQTRTSEGAEDALATAGRRLVEYEPG